MRQKSAQRSFSIVLRYEHEITRTVKVKAASREAAENRALKRNPNAIGVKRNA